jgi:cytochrome o ubiquinol oxidase subunit II
MPVSRLSRRLCSLALPLLASLLSGCNAVVLSPSGDVAAQQRDLILVATVLMLLIVVPVMVLTGLFAWHYRHSNAKATYAPEWSHSTQLELVIWSAPLLIIIALGAVTWISTHTLDPFRKITRIDADRPVAANVKPLRVQVVALDWKWLFIYPDYGIASVNELAAPVDVPVQFDITSSTVMNAFYVPALAGMIYAMPAMQTQLHAVINVPGDYEGFSANYSGAGFSGMRFTFKGLSPADFEQWVVGVRRDSAVLSREVYQQLEKPSARAPVQHYGQVAEGLYDAILNLCVEPTKMCQRDMMAIDARGGLGLAGVYNLSRLSYDAVRARDAQPLAPRDYVSALCAVGPEVMASPALTARAAPERLVP